MATLARSLALLSSLLLALPPGWCCSVGLAACGEKPPLAEKQENAPPSHKGCCCCPEALQTEPAESAPAPKPNKPVTSCCCEKQPTALPDTGWHLPDWDVSPPAIPVARLSVVRGVPGPTGRVFVASSPPLYVLHCVWLC